MVRGRFGARVDAVREVTEKRHPVTRLRAGRSIGVAGGLLAGLLMLTPAMTMAEQLVENGGASPARGHAQVVAQTVVNIGDDAVAWRVATNSAGADGNELVAAAPGFIVGNDGVLLMTDETTGAIERIAPGEAMSVLGGFGYQEAGLGDQAGYYLIGLGVDGEAGVFEGKPTDSLTGMRDLDLMRDSLGEKESVKLSAGDGPTLVVATKGTIVVDTESGQKTTLTKGHAAEFDGRITVKASADGAADFLAAVIGEPLSVAAPVSDDDLSDTPADSEVAEATEIPSAGPHELDPTDTDGDGIPDQIETQQTGTDPNNADTDGDNLSDSDEISVYYTDPLSFDSDGDGLYDFEVIQWGTNPNDVDSDHDNLSDYDEVTLVGTQPLVQDTDADGLNDGVEVNNGSDPKNADTDGDGLNDGDELLTYGSSPLSTDSDNDLIPDVDEIFTYKTNPSLADTDHDDLDDIVELAQSTDPLNPDTDGDGALDGAEITAGTNPLDPSSHP